jgi:hypothetical protein
VEINYVAHQVTQLHVVTTVKIHVLPLPTHPTIYTQTFAFARTHISNLIYLFVCVCNPSCSPFFYHPIKFTCQHAQSRHSHQLVTQMYTMYSHNLLHAHYPLLVNWSLICLYCHQFRSHWNIHFWTLCYWYVQSNCNLFSIFKHFSLAYLTKPE